MTQQKTSLQPLDFIIIFIGGAFVTGWLQQLVLGAVPAFAETTAGRIVTGLWLQDLIFLAFVALFLRGRHARWRDIGVRRPEGRSPFLSAAVAGVLLYVLMLLFTFVLNALIPGGLDAQNVSAYMQAGDALWVKGFVLLTMGVFVPIVEEIVYRGYLYHSLCSYLSPERAMLFTAIIFGAIHFDWQRFLPLAVGGYLLNVIAVRHCSIFASAISHGVWNTVMMLVYYHAL